MSKWSPLRRFLLATTALAPLGLAPVLANPLGPNVVGGTAVIGGTGTPHVTVNQHSHHAIINWHTFNIGSGETTQFIQPNSTSIALNRVTGGMGPSQLFGSLTANGRVFVVNPDGLLVGRNATINTAGFLATTSDISNENFMAGRYRFDRPGRPDASIVNQGVINSHSHGFAALVAPGVRNSGTITARFGTVGLASANTFSLDFYGDRLIQLSPNDSVAATVRDVETGLPLTSLVKNEGLIRANGGRVELTAVAARTVVDSVINNTGVIEARSVGHRNGRIVLGAATAAPGLPKQTVKVSGKLDVSSRSGKGGKIQVTGEAIEITGATFNASGLTGGGTVLIGGDTGGGHGHWATSTIPQAGLEPHAVPNATTVSIDAGTTINASATGIGNGGKVIVWADGTTSFAGTILARGGEQGGNGGFVEVSGKQTLNYTGLADLRAPHGTRGTLLLDPNDYYIDTVNGPPRPPGSSVITNVHLQNQLALGDVIIATTNNVNPAGQNGDIFVFANITWSSNFTLTLNAYRHIELKDGVTISNTGGGSLVARADVTGTGDGRIIFQQQTSGVRVDWTGSTGKVIFYDNPFSGTYATPTDFTPTGQGGGTRGVRTNNAVPNQFSYFMLVNSIPNFLAMALNTSARYALGRNIDGGNQTVNGLPFTFTGEFDGLNQTISNVIINGQAALATNSGIIRNLTLSNFTVTANSNNQFVGLLVGHNLASGQLINVHTSGTVNGGGFTGIIAGGVAGQNAGTISQNSSSSANVTVGNGVFGGLNYAGGLVGVNIGSIQSSTASGAVQVGTFAFGGGLVGQNGNLPTAGTITNSSASGAVSSAGTNVALGGLVGSNMQGALISDSFATGNVTGSGNVTGPCNGSSGCLNVNVGGLVGTNAGTIRSLNALFATFASGNVFVGSNGVAGGLVGFNSGIIRNAMASGAVTGAAGTGSLTNGSNTILGGLVGTNQGLVELSAASGNVGSSNVDRLMAGGLVGDNGGLIALSVATGNVRARNFSQAGGLVGVNDSDACSPPCTPTGDGAAFAGLSRIATSGASGNVSVGSSSIAGGLVGAGSDILNSVAIGNVSGGSNSILGGFVGVHNIHGMIQNSFATGAVTATGANTWVGGFVGLNGGQIENSAFVGSVQGGTDSIIGGFAGVNVGRIFESASLATITTIGGGNVIGGFTGVNFGTLDSNIASGSIAALGANVVGGFAGANAKFTNFGNASAVLANANVNLPFSSFPVGTIVNSTADVTITSGAGSTIGAQVGVTNPSKLPGYPSIIATCDADLCQIFNIGLLPLPPTPPPPPEPPTLIPEIPDEVIKPPNLLPQERVELARVDALIQIQSTTPPAGSTSTQGPASSARPGVPPRSLAPARELRPVAGFDGEIRSNIPPLNENRFLIDQVLLHVGLNTQPSVLQQIAQEIGLGSPNCQPMTGRLVCHFRITNGRPVRDIIRQLEQKAIVGVAQPEYHYFTVQTPAAAAAPTVAAVRRGDPAQYMANKLQLNEAHRLAQGNNIMVAVIDSEVDREHTELAGTISQRFDATESEARAHSHGTAMAGAIVSRDRLLGVAPGARILAVRAFSETQTSAESTSFTILKGIEWAVSQGARVINMSFAGPYDPSLERALKVAADKGVILIAASGNAGPKSAPLWPGADPNVIAVTATDSSDKLFRQANRGPYVSVASPGVEILAPAPQSGYQMSTGTSIATAHVSGIVALMLERDPSLTPRDVRLILESTAADLGPKGRDTQFGWGLVNPARALAMVDERKRQRGSSTPPPIQR